MYYAINISIYVLIVYMWIFMLLENKELSECFYKTRLIINLKGLE